MVAITLIPLVSSPHLIFFPPELSATCVLKMLFTLKVGIYELELGVSGLMVNTKIHCDAKRFNDGIGFNVEMR